MSSVPTFAVLEPVLGVSCAARAAHAEQQQGEQERGGGPHQHPHHHRHAGHLLHRHLGPHARVARGAAVLVVRGAAAEGLPPGARLRAVEAGVPLADAVYVAGAVLGAQDGCKGDVIMSPQSTRGAISICLAGINTSYRRLL